MDVLKSTCASLGIEQPEWRVQQHYLRWGEPNDLRNAAECGLDFDST